MIRILKFPKGQGIDFKANVNITEATGNVNIDTFTFNCKGHDYNIPADNFTLATGDQIFITPSGLFHGIWVPDENKENENPADNSRQGHVIPPTEVFPETGAYCWIVNRLENGQDYLVLEIEEA